MPLPGVDHERWRATSIDILIAKKIRECRFKKRMSVQALADVLGVSHQQLQKYENATSRVSALELYKIGRALDQPITYFFSPGKQPIVVSG
jgi:transcriptional regulator with XRE-family HTH domain